MIDYEKLKIAHELAVELDQRCSIEVAFFRYGRPRYLFNAQEFQDSFCCKSIDDLITKLQELPEPKPKYKVGQKVWMTVVCGYKLDVDSAHITSIIINNGQIEYTHDCGGNDFYVLESDLYATKEDLIEAQIQYWTCLKTEEKSTENKDVSIISDFLGKIKGLKTTTNDLPINTDLVSNHSADELEKVCDHINDGMIHMVKDGDFKAKCTKCGEFYR